MTPIRSLACALLAVASSLQGVARAAEPGRAVIPLSAFPREPIVVETRSAKRHTFDAWRADTPETREQGLMFIREMRAEQAMIFVYDPAQYVAMWMKNTLLPLDMLFVDEAGCVVKAQRKARPESLDTIQADVPVALVVELKGGITKELGIAVGDRVKRPGANWPGRDLPCTPTH